MARFTKRRILGGSRKKHGARKTRRTKHHKKHHRKGRKSTRRRRGGDLGTNLLPFALMAAKHGYQRARGHHVSKKKKQRGGFGALGVAADMVANARAQMGFKPILDEVTSEIINARANPEAARSAGVIMAPGPLGEPVPQAVAEFCGNLGYEAPAGGAGYAEAMVRFDPTTGQPVKIDGQ